MEKVPSLPVNPPYVFPAVGSMAVTKPYFTGLLFAIFYAQTEFICEALYHVLRANWFSFGGLEYGQH